MLHFRISLHNLLHWALPKSSDKLKFENAQNDEPGEYFSENFPLAVILKYGSEFPCEVPVGSQAKGQRCDISSPTIFMVFLSRY